MRGKRIVGYADQISVAPGETLNFKVSCEEGVEDYTARIVRIICGDDQPAGPGIKERPLKTPIEKTYKARKQPIHPGSYAVMPMGPEIPMPQAFTLQGFIYPLTPAKGWQGLMGWWSEPTECGFGLFIDDKGELLLAVGDGKGKPDLLRTGKKLVDRLWYFIAATGDMKTRELRLIQEPLQHFPTLDLAADVKGRIATSAIGRPNAPFMLGTILTETGDGGFTAAACFNGKIDAPRVASRALDRTEMELFKHLPLAQPLLGSVLGAWDLSQGIDGTDVVDAGPYLLHGTTVNMPMRAVLGHNWDGSETNWTHRPEHYAAIQFHDDDLHDCGWETDFTLTVPEGAKSGFYAAKLSGRHGDEDYITFFVRPPRDRATARLAFLVPTASYMAYANFREVLDNQAAELGTNFLPSLGPTDLYINDHPEIGYSTYDLHNDGSGVAYSSRLRPILNMRPKYNLWQYCADTHIIDWLDAKGIEADCITDEDLHDEGLALLERYACVMTGTHPEYYSTAMWDAVYAYTQRGGRLIYMGANGFYWRIAYHPAIPGVLEMRRAEDGSRSWWSVPGEYFMAFSGELGGMWQRSGRAPQALVGTGFTAQGFDGSSYYRRRPDSFDARAAWIFEGVASEGKIGDYGLVGGGAAGLELDRYERKWGTPPHTLLLASSEGHSDVYMLVTEEIGHNYPTTLGRDHPDVRADMTFFETPRGGAVFSTSSIAWAGSLAHNNYDNEVSRITENVVRRFLDPRPFVKD